ncbi:putative protein kinase RLK-Pelle-RLCK-VIIa-2 family [Helianthus annuus]|nr:putative protein kinase RLK-Pelle-RLCK-VIIa-2 family [Helianthus annuus]
MGQKEWETVAIVLGVVDHPNLVKLIGYCVEDNELLLVYEHMVNGSLRDHLPSGTQTPLPWTVRLKVAQGIASGFTYLHEQLDSQIIVGEFNPSDILLDDQWKAKISNFGWAELRPQEGRSHVWTTFTGLGTEGYVAPEGPHTSMSDVWSYGVFLYELITGRRPIDRGQPLKERMLIEWVKPYVESKRFNQILDPRLQEGNDPLKSAEKLSNLADKCLSANPKLRPKMSEVLVMVNQIITDMLQAVRPASPQVLQVAPGLEKSFCRSYTG